MQTAANTNAVVLNKQPAVGDTVRLKPGTRFECPEGRDNNETAKVRVLLNDVEGGLKLDRDLHGCLYWNAEDVIVVEA